jgi:UDP-N-acetylglucosamine diphosphorylase/glucosamine-1-phosphate N-acetyltransferase
VSAPFVLFEDSRWPDLRPLTETLPVPALRLGAWTVAERWRRALGGGMLAVEGRSAAMRAWRECPPPAGTPPSPGEPVWVVNAAALPEPSWLDGVRGGRCPALHAHGERIAAARLPFAQVAPGLGRGPDFERYLLSLGAPLFAVSARWLDRPWRLVEWNAELLAADLAGLRPERAGDVHAQAVLYEEDRIVVEAGARVDALAVVDARMGPVRIERGAWVAPGTVLYGPCVVGAGTWLLSGLVGASTLGPECRLQGEVDSSVFQGFANKRHQGFVGHSWVGEWANLGALTTTSDLKNNYGPVRVRLHDREHDSGLTKLGAMIGAHAKTSIGALLATGAVVGTGSNLFGGGVMSPKWLPPFSWWDGRRNVEYRLEAFLATARTVLRRRDRTLRPEEEQVFRELFAATAAERGAVAEGGAATAAERSAADPPTGP